MESNLCSQESRQNIKKQKNPHLFSVVPDISVKAAILSSLFLDRKWCLLTGLEEPGKPSPYGNLLNLYTPVDFHVCRGCRMNVNVKKIPRQ